MKSFASSANICFYDSEIIKVFLYYFDFVFVFLLYFYFTYLIKSDLSRMIINTMGNNSVLKFIQIYVIVSLICNLKNCRNKNQYLQFDLYRSHIKQIDIDSQMTGQ